MVRNGSMPSKSTMREIFASEMSEDSDEGRRRSSSVSSSDFVFDVPNNETAVERNERANKVSPPFLDRGPDLIAFLLAFHALMLCCRR
jgi:hypothetical protein